MSETTARRREADLPRVTPLQGNERVRVIQAGTSKYADLSEDLLAWLAEQQGDLAMANAPDGAVGEDGILRYPVLSVAGKGGFGGDGIILLEADDLVDAKAAGKTVLRAETQAQGRAALGLGSAATQASGAFAAASHSHAIGAISGVSTVGLALAEAADQAAGRAALGLGAAALRGIGKTSSDAAAGDDPRFVPGKVLVGTTDPGAAQDATAGFEPGSLAFNTDNGLAAWARATPAGAAKWAKLQPRMFIGGTPGKYIGPILTSNPVGTTAVTTGQLYAHLLFIPRRLPASALYLRIGTAVAGVLGRLGLYALGADEYPDARVAEINVDLDMGLAGGQMPAGGFDTTPWLDPGPIWAVSCFSGGAQPLGFAQGTLHGGGMSYLLTGHTAQQAVTQTGAAAAYKSTAVHTYTPGAPFLPAGFGAGTWSAAAPGSPCIGIVVPT